MAGTRELLVDTMKQLLWERGYDATSPNHVLQRSGAGKGSFYHHFSSKKELAIAAMEARADELIAEFETAVNSTEGDWLEKISAYLRKPRHALKGCRMGRIVQDPSLEDAELLAPLQRYFQTMQQRLEQLYSEAQQQHLLSETCNASALAMLTISAIQGAFVLGRATVADDAVNVSTDAFIQMLTALKISG